MSNPLVSIIIPTYNHARLLGLSLASVQAQTWKNLEIVVVDDGSSDHTSAIVKAAALDDPRIRYLPQPRRGVGRLAETINVGLAATSGDLVTMFPSDDLMPTWRISDQVALFDDHSVVLVFGRGMLIDESGAAIGAYPMPHDVRHVVNRPIGSVLGSLLRTNWIPQYTVLIRRSSLERIGGYLQPDGLLAEDYPTHLALATVGEFRFVDKVLGYYRQHPHQQTRQLGAEMVKPDRDYAMRFFQALPPGLQRATGASERELDRVRTHCLNHIHFQQGRRLLLVRDWGGARRAFLRGIRVGSFNTKVKSAAGLVFALLHQDLETGAKVARRAQLRRAAW